MPRIKIARAEGEERVNTIGHDALIFEYDLPGGGVGEVRFVVSSEGWLWFEGIPFADPGVLGAIWVDDQGFVRASGGPPP